MIYECKKCKCYTEVTLLGVNQKVAFAVCGHCGCDDLIEHADKQVDYTCICCGKVMRVDSITYEKIQDKLCLDCRNILNK